MKYIKIFNKAISSMEKDKQFSLNVRELFPELSPADVSDILGELKWQFVSSDENSWEQDTWYLYSHPEYTFDLAMSYSGYYWTLSLCRNDRE